MTDDRQMMMVPVEQMVQLSASSQATAEQLGSMVKQLGLYLMQLDARMRRQEELLQARVTITSAQHRQLMAASRARAAEVCDKYRLSSDALPRLRAAIRADTLGRWRIKDLHDLPEHVLEDAMEGIRAWDSYGAVRRIREDMTKAMEGKSHE